MRPTYLLKKTTAANLTPYELSIYRELNAKNIDHEYLHKENSAEVISGLLCEISKLRSKLERALTAGEKLVNPNFGPA